MDDAERWLDDGLVRGGLAAVRGASAYATREVLPATDLHAGNVLSAQGEPWLVIDPKPFVGDLQRRDPAPFQLRGKTER